MPTVYDLPEEIARAVSVRFWLRGISISAIQPWTGKQSIAGPISLVWVAEISSVPMVEEHAEHIGAIFARLGGRAGLIRISNPVRAWPIYNVKQTIPQNFNDFDDGSGWLDGDLIPPFVEVRDAVEVEDDNLVLTTLPVSLSPCFYPGDLFELRPDAIAAEHGHLYKIVAAANSDGAGEARVYFVPPLRKPVAAGTQVVLRKPTTVFRPLDDEQGIVNWEQGAGPIGRTGYTLVEELPD